jgi:hypothetical protein
VTLDSGELTHALKSLQQTLTSTQQTLTSTQQTLTSTQQTLAAERAARLRIEAELKQALADLRKLRGENERK